MAKMRLYLLLVFLILLANSLCGTLLIDHFGVTPNLDLLSGGDGAYAFNLPSLAPTLNLGTVSWSQHD